MAVGHPDLGEAEVAEEVEVSDVSIMSFFVSVSLVKWSTCWCA